MYVLDISYDFDGGRSSTERYAYREMLHILSCIEQQLTPASNDGKECVLKTFARGSGGGNGEAMLYVVARCGLEQVIDLSSYLNVRVSDGPTVPIVDSDAHAGYDDASDILIVLDKVRLLRDVAPLHGMVLVPGEVALVSFATGQEEVAYGFENTEYLEDPPSLPFEDPDPLDGLNGPKRLFIETVRFGRSFTGDYELEMVRKAGRSLVESLQSSLHSHQWIVAYSQGFEVLFVPSEMAEYQCERGVLVMRMTPAVVDEIAGAIAPEIDDEARPVAMETLPGFAIRW
jgi:hypothetical protein